MISRRSMLAGGLALPALAGCGGQPTSQPAAYAPGSTRPGLDAVIDISYHVTVTSFAAIRRSNILAIIHKVSEGGDWFDPAYTQRRRQAESAGLLWGGYHFGTRQFSGEQQAASFLSACQPGPQTVMALDLEPNDANPRNTMRLDQAEAFVLAVQKATGRLPMLYAHPAWADGEIYGRRRISLGDSIRPGSLLARCELWLADYREVPRLPNAWSSWKLWQYVADETAQNFAYGSEPRHVEGVGHCDRNMFNGTEASLNRWWKNGGRS